MNKYKKISTGDSPAADKKCNQKKTIKLIVSVALGLLAAYAISSIIRIEVKGRRLLQTPETWRELVKDHPYERQSTDLRSPCPMLNTLANHGFIARDGRDIKSEDLYNALMLMGVPPTATVGILSFVYSQLNEADPHASFFQQFGKMAGLDLDRLTIAGILEHDVSLTRNDLSLPPHGTSHPLPQYVNRMVKYAEVVNSVHDQGNFTRKNEFDIRKLRWLESYRDNRLLHFPLFAQFAAGTECSLLLDIIGREGVISLPHLKSFLLDEEFPEDWYPRETTYSYTELATKPFVCWKGVRESKVSLDLINDLD